MLFYDSTELAQFLWAYTRGEDDKISTHHCGMKLSVFYRDFLQTSSQRVEE